MLVRYSIDKLRYFEVIIVHTLHITHNIFTLTSLTSVIAVLLLTGSLDLSGCCFCNPTKFD